MSFSKTRFSSYNFSLFNIFLLNQMNFALLSLPRNLVLIGTCLVLCIFPICAVKFCLQNFTINRVMAIILAMAVTIEVALPFRITIGCPLWLLLVFISRPTVASVGKTVRFINFNDLSVYFLNFNTFRYFWTFSQINKTSNGSIFRIVALFRQESSGPLCKECRQEIN